MANDEFGDFQTPEQLADLSLATLVGVEPWARVLEPTCGAGAFLLAAKRLLPYAERVGVEVQTHYATIAADYATVLEQDVFALNLSLDLPWVSDGPLLVIGNPPWVTVANLTVLGSTNMPVKENIRRLTGLDAMTGASNFDIAEYIWIKLMKDLEKQEPTIALLCKTQVARNVLSFAHQAGFPIARASIRRIDSMKWFGAGVDACLFTVKLTSGASNYFCDVYDNMTNASPSSRFGIVGGKFVSDMEAHAAFGGVDGVSPVEWRQGIKHDATDVMELVEDNGPRQKSGQPVDIEPQHLFPLLKCTDVFRDRLTPSKYMVVPMRSLSEDTEKLATTAPRLWAYLTAHGEKLDGRQSSIYKSRSRFCIFGVGPYSFAPYKVAISGFHKQPMFRLVTPDGQGREVVFDDTCYFLSFDAPAEASMVAAVLASAPVQRTIDAIAFWDSKRPITKKLLQRIDLAAAARLSNDVELVTEALALAANAGLVVDQIDCEAALATLLIAWETESSAAPRRKGKRTSSADTQAEAGVQFGLF